MAGLKDIKLVSTVNANGDITYGFPKSSSCVTGRDLLVQKIVKLLLTNKASNISSERYGCNFNTFFLPRAEKDIQVFKELFPIILNDVTAQIKLDQIRAVASGKKINDEEFLSDLHIKKLEFNAADLTWDLQVEVVTKSVNTTLRLT